MNKEEHISSGFIELYVAGATTEAENEMVYQAILEFPEVLQEIVNIEGAIVKLTAAMASNPSSQSLQKIKARLNQSGAEIIPIDSRKDNWMKYLGWAAAVLLAVGLVWQLSTYSELEQKNELTEAHQEELQKELERSTSDLTEAKELIAIIRNKNITKVSLAGQEVSPTSFAQVFWDKENKRLYLDVAGLPQPSDGKEYQLWSLTLDPLTPTDLGVIKNFGSDSDMMFEIENPNESQAFGITLEPEGGSEAPTLEQLYVLGVVNS